MEITTFEALCLTIATSHGSMTLLTVYRPGSASPTGLFFDEFSSVQKFLITRNTQLLIICDFNLHLEVSPQPSSTRFLDLLTQFGLRQHANEATHLLGHLSGLMGHFIIQTMYRFMIYSFTYRPSSTTEFSRSPLPANPHLTLLSGMEISRSSDLRQCHP